MCERCSGIEGDMIKVCCTRQCKVCYVSVCDVCERMFMCNDCKEVCCDLEICEECCGAFCKDCHTRCKGCRKTYCYTCIRSHQNGRCKVCEAYCCITLNRVCCLKCE